jgi:hypothetical protein
VYYLLYIPYYPSNGTRDAYSKFELQL